MRKHLYFIVLSPNWKIEGRWVGGGVEGEQRGLRGGGVTSF